MITLVPATLADAPIILAFMEKAKSLLYNPLDRGELEQAITGEYVYLILSGNDTVGAAVCLDMGDYMMLDEFVVDDAFRKRGIGGDALTRIFRSFAPVPWKLMTHPENPAARLYRKHGFVDGEIVPDKYGDGEPRMWMDRAA